MTETNYKMIKDIKEVIVIVDKKYLMKLIIQC